MKILFLDRDGIINVDNVYISNPKDFVFIDDVFDLCSSYIEKGYIIVVVTNQTGIGAGKYSLDDFISVNDYMLEGFRKHNIEISDVFYCPHHPNDDCSCHKPKPGMFLEALSKYKANPNDCIMIGDKSTDAIAAYAAGIKEIYLYNKKDDEKISFKHKLINNLKEV